MAYYNRNHKRLKLNGMKYLNYGGCAKILYNKDIIFKEYYSETAPSCKLSPKMFDMLKQINNPHFIELFDIYSDFDFIELVKNKMELLPFIVDAYTAKYYPANSVNALYEQKDYILDNFRELEILFDIFSQNKICTDDIKKSNTIISKTGIIIIDPDLFYTSESSKESISTLNKKNLLDLFKSICMNSATNELNYVKLKTFTDNELANIIVTENTDITYEISKKLKYIKKPIEILKK